MSDRPIEDQLRNQIDNVLFDLDVAVRKIDKGSELDPSCSEEEASGITGGAG